MFDWIGIPVVFIGLASSVVGILAFVRANYIKCSPNEVLIFFGRKHKIAVGTGPEAQEVERGYRVITGGGAFEKL